MQRILWQSERNFPETAEYNSSLREGAESDVDIPLEARRAFFETIREKRKSIPSAAGVSKKRPRHVVMPSELIDRRKYPSYRSSKVKRYLLDAAERLELFKQGEMHKMSTQLGMTMEQFRRLPIEHKCEILKPLVKDYSDMEIARMLGSNKRADADHIGYIRRRYNVLRKKQGFQPRRTAQVVFENMMTTASTVMMPSIKVTAPINGIHLSLSGTFNAADVVNRLQALAMMVESVGIDGTYEVEIALREAQPPKMEESPKPTPASNGAIANVVALEQ